MLSRLSIFIAATTVDAVAHHPDHGPGVRVIPRAHGQRVVNRTNGTDHDDGDCDRLGSHSQGSVYTGMLIHFIYNGFINLVMRYQDELSTYLNFEGGDKAHLPITWIAGAFVLTSIGLSLVYLSGKSQSSTPNLRPQ